LSGADLKHAQLQGAVLKHAQLQGADLNHAHLQGANLDSARFHGANSKGADLQSTWGKIDLGTGVNWDELLHQVSSTIPEPAREEFVNRITEAKDRSQKFGDGQALALEAKLTKINANQFIMKRNALACGGEHIAQGLIRQYRYSDFAMSLRQPSMTKRTLLEGLRQHMNTKCPEIAKKIDWPES
jgi:hypothetical protein